MTSEHSGRAFISVWRLAKEGAVFLAVVVAAVAERTPGRGVQRTRCGSAAPGSEARTTLRAHASLRARVIGTDAFPRRLLHAPPRLRLEVASASFRCARAAALQRAPARCQGSALSSYYEALAQTPVAQRPAPRSLLQASPARGGSFSESAAGAGGCEAAGCERHAR